MPKTTPHFICKLNWILLVTLLPLVIPITNIAIADEKKKFTSIEEIIDSMPKPSSEEIRRMLFQKTSKNEADMWISVSTNYIRGRDEVIDDQFKEEYLRSPINTRGTVIASLRTMGITNWKEQEKWITSKKVIEFYVWALEQSKEPRFRITIINLLVSECPDSLVRPYADRLLAVIKENPGVPRAALLLGKIGGAEAKERIQKNDVIAKQDPAATKLALAKLGDSQLIDQYIAVFKAAKCPDPVSPESFNAKAAAAKDLGYIGTEACAKALGQAIRDGEVLESRVSKISIRVEIIKALSCIYPDEPVFWEKPDWKLPHKDSYYEQIEDWLTRKLGLSWDHPRPPFLYIEEFDPFLNPRPPRPPRPPQPPPPPGKDEHPDLKIPYKGMGGMGV